MDELDKELEKRSLQRCRFADDCNIFVKTERAAKRVMQSIKVKEITPRRTHEKEILHQEGLVAEIVEHLTEAI